MDFSFQCLLSNHFIILDLIKSVWFSVFLHIVWFIVQLPNGLKSFGFERRVLREGSGGGFEKIIEQLPSLPSFDVVTSLACEKFVIRGVSVTELCKFLTPQPLLLPILLTLFQSFLQRFILQERHYHPPSVLTSFIDHCKGSI